MCCFLIIAPSYNSFLIRLKKRRHAFSTNFTFFVWFFGLDNIDLVSPKLHAIEIFYQTTFQIHLMILAFIGADLAGRGRFCPPPLPWLQHQNHAFQQSIGKVYQNIFSPQRRFYTGCRRAGRPYGRHGAVTDRATPDTKKWYVRGGCLFKVEIGLI